MSKHTQRLVLGFIGFIILATGGLVAYYQYASSRNNSVAENETDAVVTEPNDLNNSPAEKLTEDELEDLVGNKQPDTSEDEAALKEKVESEFPVDAEPESKDKQPKNAPEGETVYYINETTPNDPIYPQWYSNAIEAPEAWDVAQGESDTVVAVIDTGFALGHEDLNSAWYENNGETGKTRKGDRCWTGKRQSKKTNNCDDDRNGFVDDWRGWDFANNDEKPKTGQHGAGNSHATKVSGLVGARTNNSKGVAAINWRTKILPLQGLYDEGFGYTSDIVAAIVYAVNMDVDVINLSLGSPYSDNSMQSALQYAKDHDVIVVAAAGNCGADQSSYGCYGTPSPGGMTYPARYDEVISVGATTIADQRASFSSYGSALDLVAPGSGTIRTPTYTSSNNKTAYSSTAYGTSFASPIVAGAAASIKGLYPDASFDEVRDFLMASAATVTDMDEEDFTDEYGDGLLDTSLSYSSTVAYLADAGADVGEADFLNRNPLVVTNIGTRSSLKIRGNRKATSYCLAKPEKACRLVFKKNGSSRKVIFRTKTVDDNGIISWRYKANKLGNKKQRTGTWRVYAKLPGKSSSPQTLYVR